jgi:hypothetical protein
MEYAKMRAIAEELTEYAERLEGAWNVEIGPSGPFKDPYIFGDTVPFGPWTVATDAFRRHGKAGGTQP